MKTKVTDCMFLLNCRSCDDVVKLVDKLRSCECGRSQGAHYANGSHHVSGPARVLTITWEAYDGITEGESRPFTVLPRVQPKRQPL